MGEVTTTTLARVTRLIKDHWGTNQAEVADLPNARLIADLNADSLDIVELSMAAEDEFGIELTDDETEIFASDDGSACKTVADFCALIDSKLAAKVPA